MEMIVMFMLDYTMMDKVTFSFISGFVIWMSHMLQDLSQYLEE